MAANVVLTGCYPERTRSWPRSEAKDNVTEGLVSGGACLSPSMSKGGYVSASVLKVCRHG